MKYLNNKEQKELEELTSKKWNVLSIEDKLRHENLLLNYLQITFIGSKVSKTDYTIMCVLIREYFDIETSTITIPSFQELKKYLNTEMDDGNISRSLKKLVDNNFLLRCSTKHQFIAIQNLEVHKIPFIKNDK